MVIWLKVVDYVVWVMLFIMVYLLLMLWVMFRVVEVGRVMVVLFEVFMK